MRVMAGCDFQPNACRRKRLLNSHLWASPIAQAPHVRCEPQRTRHGLARTPSPAGPPPVKRPPKSEPQKPNSPGDLSSRPPFPAPTICSGIGLLRRGSARSRDERARMRGSRRRIAARGVERGPRRDVRRVGRRRARRSAFREGPENRRATPRGNGRRAASSQPRWRVARPKRGVERGLSEALTARLKPRRRGTPAAGVRGCRGGAARACAR
jgi:hypothetical protein